MNMNDFDTRYEWMMLLEDVMRYPGAKLEITPGKILCYYTKDIYWQGFELDRGTARQCSIFLHNEYNKEK